MAKTIDVSDDNGVTWNTLPGSSGEINEDAESIDDTIFGQTWQSNEVGLITWTISADAVYKGFAGYKAKLKDIGTTTAFTDEATSNTTGLTYQIDDTTKRIWDRSVTVTVEDNAVAVSAADIESIDYLFGKVTFVSGYSVTGPITVSGSYFPTTDICSVSSYTLTQTAETIDDTDFCTADTNGGYRTFDPGLRTVSIELSGFYDASEDYRQQLIDRAEVIIEVNPDGNGDSIARGFFKPQSHGQSGDVGALEEETVTFNLTVPDDDTLETPFSWEHSNTSTIPDAVKILLTAFLDETLIDVRYLHDGTNGASGKAMVSDVSLEGSLDGMNMFTADFQGSGALSAVP